MISFGQDRRNCNGYAVFFRETLIHSGKSDGRRKRSRIPEFRYVFQESAATYRRRRRREDSISVSIEIRVAVLCLLW